jgi:hypothetical protein
MPTDLDKRFQALIILWVGIASSIGLLFAVTLFVPRDAFDEPTNPPSAFLLFALAALGTFLVVISFAVKRKILQTSVEKQDVTLVQKAVVIACALCEAAALLGLLGRFVAGTRDYLLLFLVAAVGIALHFPKRDQLIAASWNDQSGPKAL